MNNKVVSENHLLQKQMSDITFKEKPSDTALNKAIGKARVGDEFSLMWLSLFIRTKFIGAVELRDLALDMKLTSDMRIAAIEKLIPIVQDKNWATFSEDLFKLMVDNFNIINFEEWSPVCMHQLINSFTAAQHLVMAMGDSYTEFRKEYVDGFMNKIEKNTEPEILNKLFNSAFEKLVTENQKYGDLPMQQMLIRLVFTKKLNAANLVKLLCSDRDSFISFKYGTIADVINAPQEASFQIMKTIRDDRFSSKDAENLFQAFFTELSAGRGTKKKADVDYLIHTLILSDKLAPETLSIIAKNEASFFSSVCLEAAKKYVPIERDKTSKTTTVTKKKLIPMSHMGHVIGKKGRSIKSIRIGSGAKVDLNRKSGFATIKGSPEQVEEALEMINKKLKINTVKVQTKALQTFSVGQVLQGKITELHSFALFLSLPGGTHAYLHCSKILDGKGHDIHNSFNVGDTLKVEISEIDPDERINVKESK